MSKSLNQLVVVIMVAAALLVSSCNKQYTCTCKNIKSNKDTTMDVVETTKLGSKGFNKTCSNYETSNVNLRDCHLK